MTIPAILMELCESCQRALASNLVLLEGAEPFAVCNQCAP